MDTPLHILLVDDDEDEFILTRGLLAELPVSHQLTWVSDVASGLAAVQKGGVDVCLCDFRLGASTGIDFLNALGAVTWPPPVIVLTGQGNREVDIAVMKAGAADYLAKDGLDASKLERSIRYALERHHAIRSSKEAEAQLRHSLSLVQATLNSTADGILVVDLNGRIVSFNGKMLEMWHIPAGMMECFDDNSLLAYVIDQLADPRSFMKKVRELYAQPEAESHDLIEFHDGRVLERYSQPQRIEGQCVGRVWSFRDITRRKQAEDALRLQLSRISLLNRISRAIAERQDMKSIFQVTLAHLELHFDISFGQVFRYEPVADTLTVAACGPRSLALADRLQLPEGAKLPLHTTDLRACINGEVVYHSDLAQRHDDNAKHLLAAGLHAVASVPLSADGKVFGVLSLARQQANSFRQDEIEFLRTLAEHISLAARHAQLHSELQLAYNRLQESQQAAVRQERLAAVGHLSAGVAHEFNNILTIIQGYASLLMRQQSSPEFIADAVNNIVSGAERASRLTAQLLAFSRKQVLQPQRLDVNEVVGNVTKVLSRLVGEKIQTECNFAANPLFVWADLGMVEQVVLNLAVNARDAMPLGGKLSLTTREVHVSEAEARSHPDARPGDFVSIVVTDSGCGMSPDTMARLFEPFFTTKEVGKGTGLGLATVYGIVKQHQGWIEVHSRLGLGSSFAIFLPVHQAKPGAEGALGGPPQVQGGNETILVVEDEPALRLLVRDILRSYGYRILDANNGPEALHLWDQQEGKIDLLLTDLVMPGGMNGDDVARALQEKRPGLKVVYSSGYSVDMAGKNLANEPGIYFLPKPYRPATLARIVRDCLDGRPFEPGE